MVAIFLGNTEYSETLNPNKWMKLAFRKHYWNSFVLIQICDKLRLTDVNVAEKRDRGTERKLNCKLVWIRLAFIEMTKMGIRCNCCKSNWFHSANNLLRALKRCWANVLKWHVVACSTSIGSNAECRHVKLTVEHCKLIRIFFYRLFSCYLLKVMFAFFLCHDMQTIP